MNLKQFWILALFAVLVVLSSAVMSLVRDQLYAQTVYPGTPRSGEELFVLSQNDGMLACFSTREDVGIQSVTIVDPETKRVAFYRIQLQDGTITLKSVRDIGPDLEFRHYNGTDPLPQDIEKFLNQPSR